MMEPHAREVRMIGGENKIKWPGVLFKDCRSPRGAEKNICESSSGLLYIHGKILPENTVCSKPPLNTTQTFIISLIL